MPQPNKIAARVPEGERLMTICNACRYCEGFCDVFPAMERRLQFTEADINYLANLCHNCAECYYACQYAPPHEFAVNVPQVFAEIRAQSYRKYAWPKYLRVSAWLAVAVGMIIVVLLAGGRSAADANFYGVIPHDVMIATFGVVAAFIFTVHIMGLLRFWRESGGERPTLAVMLQAARDALSLKNLDSNGAGCTYPDEHHSQARRRFHHFTFYGFLLCFASTTVAAIYHFTGRIAPHPYLSLPVVLGTLGGIGLLIGPAGLYWLKRRRDTGHRRHQTGRRRRVVPRAAVSDESYGVAAVNPARNHSDGPAAADSSGRRAGLVPDATLREVRARHLPLGRSGALRA